MPKLIKTTKPQLAKLDSWKLGDDSVFESILLYPGHTEKGHDYRYFEAVGVRNGRPVARITSFTEVLDFETNNLKIDCLRSGIFRLFSPCGRIRIISNGGMYLEIVLEPKL